LHLETIAAAARVTKSAMRPGRARRFSRPGNPIDSLLGRGPLLNRKD